MRSEGHMQLMLQCATRSLLQNSGSLQLPRGLAAESFLSYCLLPADERVPFLNAVPVFGMTELRVQNLSPLPLI